MAMMGSMPRRECCARSPQKSKSASTSARATERSSGALLKSKKMRREPWLRATICVYGSDL